MIPMDVIILSLLYVFYLIRFKFLKLVSSCKWGDTTLIFVFFQEESSKAFGKNKKVRKDKKRSEH